MLGRWRRRKIRGHKHQNYGILWPKNKFVEVDKKSVETTEYIRINQKINLANDPLMSSNFGGAPSVIDRKNEMCRENVIAAC